MALTKITGQVINDTTGLVVGVTTVGGGISATDGFFSGIVTAVGNASFSGNVSVGGTLTYEDVTNIDAVGLVTARNGIVVGSGITLSKDGDVFFTGIATGNGSGLTALNASNLASGTVPTARLGSGTASSSTFLAGDSTFKTVTGTTINSNADNRLITGSGTANTLNGESGVTYDGTDFTISSGVLKLTDESNGQQLRIGAAGDFYIEHDGSNTYLKNTTGDTVIQNDNNVKITASSGGTERFKVDSSGNATISNGNLVIGTAGKGIDFSATANSSASGATMSNELLDDYEEGSWTPQIRKYVSGSFSTAAGMSDNGTVQRSKYTKIGDMVTVHLHWNGFQVSDANYAALGGLPFNTTTNGGGGGSVGYTDAFTNNQNLGVLVGADGDNMYFYINNNQWNGWSTSSNRDIYVTVSYFTS